MSNVDFPGEKFNRPTYAEPKTSTMVKFVMKVGLAKSEKTANYVLLGIAVLFFVLTIIIFINIHGTPPDQKINQADRDVLIRNRVIQNRVERGI